MYYKCFACCLCNKSLIQIFHDYFLLLRCGFFAVPYGQTVDLWSEVITFLDKICHKKTEFKAKHHIFIQHIVKVQPFGSLHFDLFEGIAKKVSQLIENASFQ